MRLRWAKHIIRIDEDKNAYVIYWGNYWKIVLLVEWRKNTRNSEKNILGEYISIWAVVVTCLESSALGSVRFISTVAIWVYLTRTWVHIFSCIFYKYLFPLNETYVLEKEADQSFMVLFIICSYAQLLLRS